MWCPPCTCPVAPHPLSASRPPPEHLPLPPQQVSFPSECPLFLRAQLECHHLISHSMSLYKFIPQVTILVLSFPSDRGCWKDRKSCLSHAACIGGVTMTREARGVQEQGTWVSGTASAVTNSDQQTGSTEATQLKLSAQDPRASGFSMK